MLPPEREEAIANWVSQEENRSGSSRSAGGGAVQYHRSTVRENAPEEGNAGNLEVLQNLVELGKHKFNNEDYTDAQRYLEVARDMVCKKMADGSVSTSSRDALGQYQSQLTEILDILADVYRKQTLYLRCYQVLRDLEGLPMRSELSSLSLKHDLAEVCLYLEKLAEGREYCEAALRGREALLGARNQKSYESVSLMADILYASGETALADAYKTSLPLNFQSNLARRSSAASLATLATADADQSASAHSASEPTAALFPPSSYYADSTVSRTNVVPTAVYNGARQPGSSISVASTLYRPLDTPITEVSVSTFLDLCEHVDALRDAGRYVDAGREGVSYLKYATKHQKWSYWEAWDLIEEHIAQFGMNGGAVGRSPLHVLCYCGLIDHVEALLDRGATVNGRARGWKTALHIAAGTDHNIVRLLISNGADMEAADMSKWTALHHAANHGKTECVRVLIESGAQIMARNDRNQTAAMIARSKKKKDIACLLDPVRGGKVSWFGLGSY